MPFAKRYCRLNSFVGHVWQGRFKSLLIDTDAYLYACGNYIEMNPVRAGLVMAPEDWHHSSYEHYAHGLEDQLVDTDPFYLDLGKSAEERQRQYRHQVTGAVA